MPTFEAWRWGLLTNTMQPSVVAMVMLLMNLPQRGSSREAKLPPTCPCGAARRRCGFWPAHGVPPRVAPGRKFRSGLSHRSSVSGASRPQACASVAMALSRVLGSFGGLSHALPRACKATSGLQRGQFPRRGLTWRQRPMLWPAWSPTSLAGCDTTPTPHSCTFPGELTPGTPHERVTDPERAQDKAGPCCKPTE